MLRQTKFKMNKLGLSAIVGYVLLTSFAIIMGGIIYYWMKSYTPSDGIACPDDVSVFIENFECTSSKLSLTIKNNGKFNISGYFLRGTNKENTEVATIDLSGGEPGGIVRFDMAKSLSPGNSDVKNIQLTQSIYSIEIIPIRYEVIENKNRLATCSKAKISEKVNCVVD
mgnify:CR=1 FL=1